MRLRLPILIIALAVVAVVASQTFFAVRETEQVLVMQFGNPKRIIAEPGLNYKLPFIQQLLKFDDRILDYDANPQEVPTIDQKQVVVDAYARYRIIDALNFYQTVRNELGMQQRLESTLNDALRGLLGDVSLAVIMTPERAELMADLTKIVSRNVESFGIEVLDVRIRRIDLPTENSQAIFRRMQTQREQEARKIRAEGDKESRRIRADADKQTRVIIAEAKRTAEMERGLGDAEAQRVYNESYGQDPEFFDFWRSLQALAKGLSADTTTYIGNPEGDFFRFFNSDTTGATGGKQE